MSDIAIRVDNLSKMYRIGTRGEQPRGLAQAARTLVASPFGYLQRMRRLPTAEETLWALKDVSFEVKHGEVLGIIGRNGAGKSTLLKILSRITEPSSGQAQVFGRVGSLLEVGTGFHPELTGRENIYLNGAILGMKRGEIDRKFDEIVDFSGVERFLDTPVKRYSSGMYVRLAFAVAAHLEPEILIIDEVLAVGDADFQKKCLGKMGNIAKQGRTVLFVSHNLAAIKSLCNRGVLLQSGQLRKLGAIDAVVATYMQGGHSSEAPQISIPLDSQKTVQISSVSVVNEHNEPVYNHPYTSRFQIEVEVVLRDRIAKMYVAIHVQDSEQSTILFSRDFESSEDYLGSRAPGRYTYSIAVPSNILVPGTYRISVHVARSLPAELLDGVDNVCPFNIIDDRSARAEKGFPWQGKVAIPLVWELRSCLPVSGNTDLIVQKF